MTKRTRLWLYGILCLAFAIRATVALTQPYVEFPDEIFQYLEQAHRLAFGSGVVPWEYHDGARSWLLPGLLAGIMKLCAWFDGGSVAYIDAIRLTACLLSLSVVWVGFRLGLRGGGLGAAILAGGLAAIWFDAVQLSPSVMTEIVAAYVAFGAVYLAERRGPSDAPTTMVGAGILLGLACSLRFQMAPTALVIAAFHCRWEWRRRWLPLVLGGSGTALAILGLLDYATWGAPFHSVIVNYVRNVPQGLSTAISSSPFYQYGLAISAVWTAPGLLLLLLIPLGVGRAPVLASAAATTFLVHSLLGHKEYRFIAFALLAAPILIALGAARLFERFERAQSAAQTARTRGAFLAICGFLSGFAWFAGGGRVLREFNTGTLEAFLAAHDESQLCGLGVLHIGWAATAGYAYLHRDVPLYFSEFHYRDNVLDFMKREGVDLRLTVTFRHQDLPQFPERDFARHTDAYNFLVAKPDEGLPGFTRLRCFANMPISDYPSVCLFRRPGTCDARD